MPAINLFCRANPTERNFLAQLQKARFQRRLAGVFIVGYLTISVGFLGLQVLGDVSLHSIAYFWTWDMFPDYACLSTRRLAVGRTHRGQYVAVFPGPGQQFRWGLHQDFSRVELDRLPGTNRRVIEETLRRTAAAHAADPIETVTVIEQYWPARFNYPPALYETLYGQPRPDRRYWRVVEQLNDSGRFLDIKPRP